MTDQKKRLKRKVSLILRKSNITNKSKFTIIVNNGKMLIIKKASKL